MWFLCAVNVHVPLEYVVLHNELHLKVMRCIVQSKRCPTQGNGCPDTVTQGYSRVQGPHVHTEQQKHAVAKTHTRHRAHTQEYNDTQSQRYTNSTRKEKSIPLNHSSSRNYDTVCRRRNQPASESTSIARFTGIDERDAIRCQRGWGIVRCKRSGLR